jgi:broad specificity phosphatase PhoE/catechol 2,3-dioxygenase-like lactoylglutathione lyase family enzyme
VELVYETHALTTDNESGIATGWLPGTLSERGRANAVELGRRRRQDNISAIVVSDLRRAIETVEIAFAGVRIPVLHDGRLRECNYGALNGMPSSRLEAERAGHVRTPWPAGESYADVVSRTASLLEEIAAQWGGSRLLLVGHSANKWALDYLLLGRPLDVLVREGLAWQEGWEYALPAGWSRRAAHTATDVATGRRGKPMFRDTKAFSGFSVDDIEKVRPFYADTLGVDVRESNGMLELRFGDTAVLVYPKGAGHEAATYTVLNFPVPDVEKAVDELTAKGVVFERYEGAGQDEKGIAHNEGPLIAWFKDPAGNILSVIEDGG